MLMFKPRSSFLGTLSAAALVLALVASGQAQQKPEIPRRAAPPGASGKIVGKVTEKGKEPIAFANVIVLGTKQGTMTDENGNYVLAGVPVGAATIQVQAIGYDKQSQTVQVNAGGTATLNFSFGESKTV